MHAHTQNELLTLLKILDTPFHHYFRASQQLQFSTHLAIFQNCWDYLQWLKVVLPVYNMEREMSSWMKRKHGSRQMRADSGCQEMRSWFLTVDVSPTLCEAWGIPFISSSEVAAYSHTFTRHYTGTEVKENQESFYQIILQISSTTIKWITLTQSNLKQFDGGKKALRYFKLILQSNLSKISWGYLLCLRALTLSEFKCSPQKQVWQHFKKGCNSIFLSSCNLWFATEQLKWQKLLLW